MTTKNKLLYRIFKAGFPTGRAWKNEDSFFYLLSVINQLENAKEYCFNRFNIRKSFAIHYDNWKKVLNLPDETDEEKQYINVAERITAKGEQNINYFIKELEKIGVFADITLCYEKDLDPAEFFKPPAGIELNETDLQLNSERALLNYGAMPTHYTAIINHYDTDLDKYLTQEKYITKLKKRWAFAFVIHAKNMKYDQPLKIDGAKRDEVIRKIIEIKNFGTWAILNAQFI